MAINVSVQYIGGLLPDLILLTQGCYHRGTSLNAMKRFCICSLCETINYLLLLITITLFDDVLLIHSFCFVFASWFGVPAWRLM